MDLPTLSPVGTQSSSTVIYTVKPLIIASISIFVALTTLAVGARLVIKLRTKESVLIEDCQYSISTDLSSLAEIKQTPLFLLGCVYSLYKDLAHELCVNIILVGPHYLVCNCNRRG